ncbi:MAG: hypothetical protein IJ088_13380 [Clostridia bacterium]|nr:hypothetical protein [Clostridia bacterium]
MSKRTSANDKKQTALSLNRTPGRKSTLNRMTPEESERRVQEIRDLYAGMRKPKGSSAPRMRQDGVRQG